MRQHIARPLLLRLFGEALPQAEADTLLPHLNSCIRCRSLAVEVIGELRRKRELTHLDAERAAFFTSVGEDERRATELLRARGAWAELKELDLTKQIERVRTRTSLQTVAMFETIVGEAKSLAPGDPYLAEQQALTAEAVAQVLPETRFSAQFKLDRQGEALTLLANCRRLAADWAGSHKALVAAKNHLKRGTGDPLLTARFLSIHASLLSDTGRTETALEMLRQAEEILRREEEIDELCSCLLKQAGTLMADNRPEEALVQAGEALQLVSGAAVKRERLARAIMVESLIDLERPSEALQVYAKYQALFDELTTQPARLQISYLEARLLDVFGFVRESERIFRKVVDGYFEADLYKESLRVALTLFDFYFRRSSLDKAAAWCQEIMARLEQLGGREQMIAAWGELLQLVVTRALERRHVVEAQRYLMRHWHQPATSPPFTISAATDLSGHPEPQSQLETLAASPDALELEESPPSNASDLLVDGFRPAVERFERDLISKVLSQTGGRIRETTRILGMSRNGLKSKMRQYGLVAGKDEDDSD